MKKESKKKLLLRNSGGEGTDFNAIQIGGFDFHSILRWRRLINGDVGRGLSSGIVVQVVHHTKMILFFSGFLQTPKFTKKKTTAREQEEQLQQEFGFFVFPAFFSDGTLGGIGYDSASPSYGECFLIL
jgi:hypothetical protein